MFSSRGDQSNAPTRIEKTGGTVALTFDTSETAVTALRAV
jgi:hypothetical protein